MATRNGRVKGQWRGLVTAIVFMVGMMAVGAWSLGWLNRDISVIGGALTSGARKFLQVDAAASDILPGEQPDILYGHGNRRDLSLDHTKSSPDQANELSYSMQQHLKRGATLGYLKVVDGDVVSLNGRGLRLWGIDAPDIQKICNRYGRAWRCGEAAAHALREFVQNTRIACYDRGVDRFKRPLAECYTDDVNLSEWMAGEGWAFGKTPYTSNFAMTMGIAQARQKGIWIDPEMRDPKRWNVATTSSW